MSTSINDDLMSGGKLQAALFSTDASGNTVLVGGDGNTLEISRIGNRVAVIGDSRMVAAPPLSTSDYGILNWALVFSGQRCNVVSNRAVGGTTTADMLSTQLPLVVTDNPTHVVVLGGTNDVANGVAADVTISNLQAIYTRLKNIGATVIACTEYPASGVYTTTAKREKLLQINAAIIDYARENANVIVANLYDVLLDAASATGDQIAGTLYDNVHTAVTGGILAGQCVADVLSVLIPPQRPINTSLIDVISATHPSGNLIVNGLMSGTAGSNSGTGMSGSVADSWVHQLEGGTATSVASKVARTDGIPGYWQRLTITSGADNTVVRVRQIPTLPAQVQPGDSVECYAELALSSVVGVIDSLHLMMQWQDGASTTLQTDYTLFPNGFPHGLAWAGIVRLPPVVIPVGATKVVVAARVRLDNTASCVVDIGAVQVKKV